MSIWKKHLPSDQQRGKAPNNIPSEWLTFP